METRASYLVVGGFVVALLAGLFLFVVWLARVQIAHEYTEFRIYFTGSVTGLQEGSPVRLRGIPVGAVTHIRLDPENVEEIEVRINLLADTPVKEDTVASIEIQGITATAYIQLSGGTKGSPLLKPKEGKKVATIMSRPSQLERVFHSAPELIDRANELVDRATELLGAQNQRAIVETLDNIRGLTGAFAAKSAEIAAAIEDSRAAARDFHHASASLDSLISSLKSDERRIANETSATLGSVRSFASSADARTGEIAKDLVPAVRDLRQTAESLHRLSTEFEGVVAENRGPWRDFSDQGLHQLTQFLGEARRMMAAITRLVNKIEADPGRALFGNQQQGVPAQ